MNAITLPTAGELRVVLCVLLGVLAFKALDWILDRRERPKDPLPEGFTFGIGTKVWAGAGQVLPGVVQGFTSKGQYVVEHDSGRAYEYARDHVCKRGK